MLWMVGAAFAADPAEEVIVWGDRFARWKHRWYVETDELFAEPFYLMALANRQIDLRGVQIRVVLDCDVDFVLTRASREVSCKIEDIGLVAVPVRYGATDGEVLQEIDATLT